MILDQIGGILAISRKKTIAIDRKSGYLWDTKTEDHMSKMIAVTERVPFGNGEWQHHDTYIAIDKIISVRPSSDGCIIGCVDGAAFDTANDHRAILAQIER